jgi:hypothetical protein
MWGTLPCVVACCRQMAQSYPLPARKCCGARGVGVGHSTRVASKVWANSLISLRLAGATTMAMGRPCPSVKTLRFVPSLPRSVGLGPVAAPQRRLGHRPIDALSGALQSRKVVVDLQRLGPEVREHIGRDPMMVAVVVNGPEWPEALAGQRPSRVAGVQGEEDPVGHPAHVGSAQPDSLCSCAEG